MGRRSKIPALRKRIAAVRAARLRRAIRGPFDCPWCHAHTMNAERRPRGLVLFGCSSCKMGDMLPLPPTYQIVDLYNMLLDKYMKNKEPIFKYKTLDEQQLHFLRRRITLGKIKVIEVMK